MATKDTDTMTSTVASDNDKPSASKADLKKAAEGQSLTTSGPDSFHESANTPIVTSQGVIGGDPLREHAYDSLSGPTRINVNTADSFKDAVKDAMPEVVKGNAASEAAGEVQSVARQLAAQKQYDVLLQQNPAGQVQKGPWKGNIQGLDISVGRGERKKVPYSVVAALVSSDEIASPGAEFDQYVNHYSPEELAKQKIAGGALSY